jgi:radical SAM superfamily enzyme YgiQ (UPF0313 family)
MNQDDMVMGIPPLGIATLAAYLRSRGYQVELDDLYSKLSYHRRRRAGAGLAAQAYPDKNNILRMHGAYLDYLMKGILRPPISELLAEAEALIEDHAGAYEVVGIAGQNIFQFLFSLILLKRLKEKKRYGAAPHVLGGAFVTLLGHKYLEKFDFIDYMFVGDAELGMAAFMAHVRGGGPPLAEIPGLVYRGAGGSVINEKKGLPIDAVLPPDFDGIDLKCYGDGKERVAILPYQTQKGCNARCSFCVHHTFSETNQRKSAAKIVGELRLLSEKYRVRHFYFCDSTLNSDYQWLEDLCDALCRSGLSIRWGGMARLDNIDKRLAVRMRESGCSFLRLGMESASDGILRAIGKTFTVEQAERCLQNIFDQGIDTTLSLIVGYVKETEQDIQKNIDFIRRHPGRFKGIYCSTLWVEHNSLMQKSPEKYGLENVRNIFDEFFEEGFDPARYWAIGLGIRRLCMFDEIGGLRWADKQRQQSDSRRKVHEAIYKYDLKTPPQHKMPYASESFYELFRDNEKDSGR